MKLTEKVSYLQGLIDGLEIDESTKEGKVFSKMADILAELAEAVEGIQDEVSEMTELVDIIDQDLGDVEEALLDEDEDDDDDYEDDDDDEDFDFDDDELYEVTCPSCGDTIYLTEDMLEDGSIDCPGCGEDLEFDFDEECDCDDCDHE